MGLLRQRPDVTLIHRESYQYLPIKKVNVITFEVKLAADLNVAAVYEALSHSRRATKSYLAVCIPEQGDDKGISLIRPECERVGVGLIKFSEPPKHQDFEVMIDPQEMFPHPDELELFIEDQIPAPIQKKLAKF